MSNVYGTEKYRRYVKEYLSELTFEKTDEYTLTFEDVKTRVAFFESRFVDNGGECCAFKSIMTITSGNGENRVYECIDEFMRPSFFNYNGLPYACFRKTLYGYTILNLDDFSETNYFPSDVIEGKEAFIMCEARNIRDVLILFGCFWAGPNICYALDLKTFKIVDLSKIFGIEDIDDDGIIIAGDTVTLTGDGDTVVKTEYQELKKLVASSHNIDL